MLQSATKAKSGKDGAHRHGGDGTGEAKRAQAATTTSLSVATYLPAGQSGAGDAAVLPTAGGSRLEGAVRDRMERGFGVGFGGVRIHTGARADASARTVNALAYTVGRDVVFRDGYFSPGTPAGLKLLAHELAHVVQQERGNSAHLPAAADAPLPVGRADDPAEREADAAAGVVTAGGVAADLARGGVPRIRRQQAPTTPEPAPADPNAGIDVTTLTNREFVEQRERVRRWLAAHGREDPLFGSYDGLGQGLQAERTRRVGMGHVWLGEELLSTPTDLRILVHGGAGTIDVFTADMSVVMGVPPEMNGNPVVTPAQFDAFLSGLGLPTLTLAEYLERERRRRLDEFLAERARAAPLTGLAGGSMGVPGEYAGLPRPFSSAGRNPNLWRGTVGEVSFGGQWYGLPMADLNRVPWTNSAGVLQTGGGNFPAYDFRARWGEELPQVKTSTQATQAGRMRVYTGGLTEAMGVPDSAGVVPANFQSAVRNLAPGTTAGTPLTQAQMDSVARQARIVVNAEDVADLRDAFRDRNQITNSSNIGLLNRELSLDPATVPGKPGTYSSHAQLRSAVAAGAITQAEMNAVVDAYGERLAARVLANPLGAPELTRMQAWRNQIRTQSPALTPAQIEAFAFPETLQVVANGGGATGHRSMIGANAPRGAAFGGVFSVGGQLVVMAVDERDHPLWYFDLAAAGGTGTLTGAGATALESSVNASAGSAIARYMVTRGIAPSLSTAAGRGFGGGIAGGPAAAVTTLGMMGYEEMSGQADYTGEDYGARGTRAFVVGAASGALGAAAAGAVAGSVAPGVGTAIGFAVGLVAYLVIDYLAGDAVESGTRSVIRAASGPPQGATGAAVHRFEERPFPAGCFAGDTPVRMADGTVRHIEALRPGDTVLAFDPESGTIGPEVVQALHVHGVRPCLELHFEGVDGALRVTREHPFLSGNHWLEAGWLQPGAAVVRLDPTGAAVEKTTLVRSLTTPGLVKVFNLTVGGPHTFFAGDILVHNKNI